MPDFILYLSGEDFIYQVYIEPKGEQLVVGDSWKQDILKSINSDKFEIRTTFPTDGSLVKALYLATEQIIVKWASTSSNWVNTLSQLTIMYEDRIENYI